MKKFCEIYILLTVFHLSLGQYNDYSSFLSANASLAVVVDQDYMRQHNENIMANFQKILNDVIRENLKNGGINVKYFTWSGIRLKKDFLAAMTVMNCENTWKFFEATRATSVLLIAITDTDCPRLPLHQALMIPSVGRGEEFPQMILDAKVQKILKWKTAVVMMDDAIINENNKLVESVVHESIKNNIIPISLYLYSINDHLRSQKKRQAIREALQPFQTNPQNAHQFIVFSKFYEDIIEMAEVMNMFHVNNQWLFFILEEEHIRKFNALTVTQNLLEGTNIAFVLNETLPNCENSLNCTIYEVSMAFVLSISKLITEEQSIYGEISDEEWEALRYSKNEKQDEILKVMKEYLRDHSKCASCSKWRIDTAINWGKSQENQKIQTAVAYRENRNKNFEFINVGYWTPVLGFVTQELAFPHATHYFRNITLDILTIHNPPWQILKKNSKGVIVEHSGIVMEIVKELSRMLNFTYQLYDVTSLTDEQFNQNETDLLGTLTYLLPYQVVELIQANKFFMAAVAATVDEPDKKPFNYTNPISIQKYTFISRKPDEVSRIYLFTAPFTLETWASLVGVILITSPVLYVINRLVPMHHMQVKGFCTIKNCFWYIYGALLQQGGMYLPQADSGRLVIGFWWIVVIVLVTTYCGNLVAFLTFPKFQNGLDYFFQLFKHSEYEQFGLRNGSYFEKYAMISTRNEFHRYLERASIYNNLKEENIEAVKEGSRVNIDWRINLQLIIQNHFERDKECTFSLGKENFLDEQIAMIMPSNSPYLHLINEQITRLSQMGFIERWHQTNLPSMDKCNGRGVLRQITNHKVNLDDMQGCFLVLLLGFLLAFFVILLEYWIHLWYLNKNSKQKTLFST